jgi:hypothetical protein
MYRFITRIQGMHKNKFKHLKGIIFFTVFKGTLLPNIMDVCNWAQDPQGILSYFALA